jgi:hypothetical protein
MKRKRLLLMILLGILGLSLAYCYWAFPRQQRISTPPAQSGAGRKTVGPVAARQAAAPVEDTRLHLELLKAGNASFPGYKRNIFGSVEPPPPPPPKVVAPPVVEAPPPPPPVAMPVQQELAHFDFLGYLDKDGRKTVFLSRDQTLFLVTKGTRFGDQQQFTVTELTPEQLVIQAENDDRQIVVPLRENQPLIPVFHPGRPIPRGGGSPIFPTRRVFTPRAPVVPSPPGDEVPQNHENPAVESPPDSAPLPGQDGFTPVSPLPASPTGANEVGQ